MIIETAKNINTCIFTPCKWSTIENVLLNYHYLRRMPAGILQCYCMYEPNGLGTPIAAAVFSNGRVQYDQIYLEFSRMWISDDYGKNSESKFIAMCLRDLAKKYPNYKGVVTWADGGQGHNGAIYRAANFYFDGNSRAVKKYIGKNGRTIYERSVTENTYKLEAVKTDAIKKRYIYLFDKKQRENKRSKEHESI